MTHLTPRKKIAIISVILAIIIVVLFTIIAFLILDRYAAKRSLSLLNTDDLPIVQIHAYSYDEDSRSIQYIASGSGSFITKDHHILTNFHVISDDWLTRPLDAFEVCLTKEIDQKPVCHYTASLVDYKPAKDIAILKLNYTDIFGNAIPDDINTIDVNYNDIEVGEQIYIIGYPSIGEDTITFTKGSTSGYLSDLNGLWVKTDTKVDSGNSGGAVINGEMELIGIPTYTITETETIAYFKPLADIKDNLEQAFEKTPDRNATANRLLGENMRIIADASENTTYTHDYPNYTITLEDGWFFDYVDLLHYNDVYIENEDSSYSITISAHRFPYEISLEDYSKWFENYERDFQDVYYMYRTEYDLVNSPTYEYDFINGWLYGHGYFFTYGNYGFNIYLMQDSSINPEYEDYEEKLEEFSNIVQSMEFAEKPVYERIDKFDHSAFSVLSLPDWHILEYVNNPHSIELYREGSVGILNISSTYMSDEEYQSPEQTLENMVLDLRYDYDNVEIIEKDFNYLVKGFPMIKIVYEYDLGRNRYREMHIEYPDWFNETILSFNYSNNINEYDTYIAEVFEILNKMEVKE